MQTQIESEQRQRDEAREQAASAERRASIIAGELDEIRASVESADKARKAAEHDLHDAADRISELSNQNSNLSALKRKLESDLAALHADFDEAINELKVNDERLRKASADATRLSEELRQEQVNIKQSF